MGRDSTIPSVAATARAQRQHCHQADPAPHGMHDDRAREVVKVFAKGALDPGLEPEALAPCHALEERVDQADQEGGGDQLRAKAGTLRNAPGNDRRNGGGERQQEKELDELVAVFLHQRVGAHQKRGAIRHQITQQEVRQGGDREVDQDLDQRIDLVFVAHHAWPAP